MKLADLRVHAGLRANAIFHHHAQNRVQRQEKNHHQHDGQQHEPENPFENEPNHNFRFTIDDLRNVSKLPTDSVAF